MGERKLRGLYRLGDCAVVQDTFGRELLLLQKDYEARGLKPAWHTLKDVGHDIGDAAAGDVREAGDTLYIVIEIGDLPPVG